MNRPYPTLKGFAPSWADLTLTIGIYESKDLDIFDFSALKWSSKNDLGEQRNPGGGNVIKRTSGSAKHEAGATFYADGFQKLIVALAEVAPLVNDQSVIGLVAFGWLIQYSIPGNEIDIFATKIEGLRLTGIDGNPSEGVDPSKLDLAFSPSNVVYLVNGREIVLR